MRISLIQTRQANQFEQLIDSLVPLIFRPTRQAKRNILGKSYMGKQSNVLKHHTNATVFGENALMRCRQQLVVEPNLAIE